MGNTFRRKKFSFRPPARSPGGGGTPNTIHPSSALMGLYRRVKTLVMGLFQSSESVERHDTIKPLDDYKKARYGCGYRGCRSPSKDAKALASPKISYSNAESDWSKRRRFSTKPVPYSIRGSAVANSSRPARRKSVS